MTHFTEEQLKELETVFDLKRNETLPVRDGRVNRDSKVWWRSLDGPVLIEAAFDHWDTIKSHPNAYQVTKPTIIIQYKD